ncbi:hypothetical protein HPP92_025367 [Vanilla planifolia]|uniref:Protein ACCUMULATION AND REPLICATION OF CHLOROPLASTS 3 n=1 Tax=Vanilla planifolia TaxID=51239 RepID=A0A835PJV5_VANPL|nr:hypothetical protein HPP92_025367 [Vanilla planifolia]
MQVDTARSSLAVVLPSSCAQERSLLSLPAGRGGLWCGHLRSRIPSLRAVCTLDSQRVDAPVDVIGIGSRRDSFIDFCLASPAASTSRYRFWTIYSRDPTKVQLLERCHSKDAFIRDIELPLSVHSRKLVAILVASVGHDYDHTAAIDLLNNVKIAGGLAVAIIMMPFSFEGQRRQKEMNALLKKLRSCSKFYIVVEADSFFKLEMGTLAEALESANNTALLAVNTIWNMISKLHLAKLSTAEGKVKDVKSSQILKALESYGEVKICCGAGFSVNAAIKQAILHCPYGDSALKDFNGLVIFTHASACTIAEGDFPHIILSFRHITSYTGDILYSKVYEPDLEANLVVTTLLIVGYNDKVVTQNKGFLSGLVQNLSFFSSFFRGDSMDTKETLLNNSCSNTLIPSDRESKTGLISDAYQFEVPPDPDIPNDFNNMLLCIESFGESIGGAAELTETKCKSFSKFGSKAMVETQSNHDVGPGFHIAQLWAKNCSRTQTRRNDNMKGLSLPVGIKPSKWLPGQTLYIDHMLNDDSDYILEITGGIAADICKKESPLSARAAMMLEAEREPQKSWNPIVEIQYRGGIYRGRCQGGLPDGKGRLILMDGSFYDGFWKFGKRTGLGTFCFSNGDLFQGTWRDDLMHGKGWFYFHTGDRWFANFWKGKANGEGRFYSKDGDVFFGCFRDGWRHGDSICIDVNGQRWKEVWDDGVLMTRIPFDQETEA